MQLIQNLNLQTIVTTNLNPEMQFSVALLVKCASAVKVQMCRAVNFLRETVRNLILKNLAIGPHLH